MIKISELVSQLEELKSKHGDIPVLICENGMGGYGIHFLESVNTSKIGIDSVLEGKDEGNVSNEHIKFLFPDYTIVEDEDPDDAPVPEMDPVVYVELSAGTLIYST